MVAVGPSGVHPCLGAGMALQHPRPSSLHCRCRMAEDRPHATMPCPRSSGQAHGQQACPELRLTGKRPLCRRFESPTRGPTHRLKNQSYCVPRPTGRHFTRVSQNPSCRSDDPLHAACVVEELSQLLPVEQTQGKGAKISGGAGCTPKTCGQCKRKASEGAGYEGVMSLHAPS